MKKDYVYRIAGLGILFSVLLIWQIVVLANLVPPAVIPTASSVLAALFTLTMNGSIPRELSASLGRIIEGFLIAALLGISLGNIVGTRKFVEKTANPLIQFLRPMPGAILIPLAILYFGLGNLMIVMIVIYSCLWPILINTIDGVKNVDGLYFDVAQEFEVSGFAKFKKVILPASAPLIFSGLRVSLGIAWIAEITAEILSTAPNLGLGVSIFFNMNSGNFTAMYARIIAIAIAAYVISELFLAFEKMIIPWYEKSKRALIRA